VSGHGRTDQLLSPIRIIVQMPEPENLKVEDLSKSVKQVPHSEQPTGHGMHCREILFTPRCSPRAREFPESVDFSVRRTVAELRDVKLAQSLDFCRAMLCISAAYAVMRCLSVTFVDCVKTNNHILKIFSPSGRPIIIVFPCQTAQQYSDGDPLMGTSNAGGVGRNRNSEPISGFSACCC